MMLCALLGEIWWKGLKQQMAVKTFMNCIKVKRALPA